MKWGMNDHKRDNYTLRKAYICEDDSERCRPAQVQDLLYAWTLLELGPSITGVGRGYLAPASGYFSSNLRPNATITLIYGSSHPFNGSLSKSAHFRRNGVCVEREGSWTLLRRWLDGWGEVLFCFINGGVKWTRELRRNQIIDGGMSDLDWK